MKTSLIPNSYRVEPKPVEVEVLSLIAHQVGPHSSIDPEHARLETAIADLRVAIRG